MALALGTGASVLGGIQQGQAKKAAADQTAADLEIQAQQTREAAKKEAANIRKAGERQVGASRAATAGSGIVVDQGSSSLIQQDITQGANSDAENTLLTGERQASASQRNASNMRKSGDSAVMGSLLGSAGTVAQSYIGWKGMR
jgi:hypothetical protein